jgi:hypothetical protein
MAVSPDLSPRPINPEKSGSVNFSAMVCGQMQLHAFANLGFSECATKSYSAVT